jgi:hypothetical protein
MSTQPFTPITREDAARILSVSVTTIDHMIVTGVLPLPRTLGAQRRLYWHPDDFYGALNRALRPVAQSSECVVSESAPVVIAEPAAAPSPPPPSAPKRPRGRPRRVVAPPDPKPSDPRARQAAQIAKLNR